jgi:hypothetical protein
MERPESLDRWEADMAATLTLFEIGAPALAWEDPLGGKWTARLIWHPRHPPDQCEIQVDGDGMAPERVLCLGFFDRRFAQLTLEDLELIRRAAQARSGILWVDARDGQLWWVRERLRDPSRVQPTYANTRWTGFPRIHLQVPITFLKSCDHQRLLDDARAARPH